MKIIQVLFAHVGKNLAIDIVSATSKPSDIYTYCGKTGPKCTSCNFIGPDSKLKINPG